MNDPSLVRPMDLQLVSVCVLHGSLCRREVIGLKVKDQITNTAFGVTARIPNDKIAKFKEDVTCKIQLIEINFL